MLSLHNISVSINNSCVLHNFSYETRNAKLIAIAGPNGAGKSTLLKSICGDFGEKDVFWQDEKLHQLSPKIVARKRAVLTQKTALSFEFTTEEVVMMGRYPHFRKQATAFDYQVVKEMMERTQTSQFAKRNYHSLSGGEQQRVQTARVFAQLVEEKLQEPKLLLLDEPLNNLDVQYQFQLLEQLKTYTEQGNLVLIVMHDLNLASQFADEIIFMHQGQLKLAASPKEVLQKELLEEAYGIEASVLMHPFQNCPMIYFGNQKPKIETKLRNLNLQSA